MSDKDRGKTKASESRPKKKHPRRPTQITSATFVPSTLSPAFAPTTTTPPGFAPATTTPPGFAPITTPSPRTSHFTPPPSIPGVQSPSISQPSHSDGGPTPGSSETVAASETRRNDDKPILYLDGQGFLPSRSAANGISDIFKSHYTDPWLSWKKIPSKTREMWFVEFTRKFSFCPPEDWWAKKNFEMRGAAIMKNNLNKARKTMNKPGWMGDNVWNALCEHWGTEGFKKKSSQGKTNRSSDCGGFGGSLHTSGSITTSQHRANMTKLNGIPPTPSDLFRRTHQHKDNTWVDRRSEQVHEKYTHTLEELTQRAATQGTPPPRELDVWRGVAGMKKGRIYGLGLESTVVAGRPHYYGSCSSSSEWERSRELEAVRKEMEEIRTERDELRERVTKTERTVKHNNKMINLLMKKMNCESMPSTTEEAEEEEEEEEESESESQSASE